MSETSHQIQLKSDRKSYGKETYTQEVKDLALSVWAFEGQRKYKNTADILRSTHDLSVNAQSIRYWAIKEDWDEEARRLYQKLAPGALDHAKASMVSDVVEAVKILGDMATGRIPTDWAQARVIGMLMDRLGLAPQSNPIVHMAMNIHTSEGIAARTDAELDALAAGYGSTGIEVPDPNITDIEYTLASKERGPHRHTAKYTEN